MENHWNIKLKFVFFFSNYKLTGGCNNSTVKSSVPFTKLPRTITPYLTIVHYQDQKMYLYALVHAHQYHWSYFLNDSPYKFLAIIMIEKVYWELDPWKEKKWAGAGRRQWSLCSSSGQRVSIKGVPSWVEMASPEYQFLGQSFTGGCHKKTVFA